MAPRPAVRDLHWIPFVTKDEPTLVRSDIRMRAKDTSTWASSRRCWRMQKRFFCWCISMPDLALKAIADIASRGALADASDLMHMCEHVVTARNEPLLQCAWYCLTGRLARDKAAEGKTYCYDFHATILHLLGIDHKRLIFRQNGIDRRLTDVHGHVVKDILA